jgi:ComEC/Rec2-related protein
MIAGIVAAINIRIPLPLPLLIAVGCCSLAAVIYEFVSEKRWREWPTQYVFIAAFICAMPLGYWRTSTLIGTPSDNTLSQALTQIPAGSSLSVMGNICHEPELRKTGQLDIILRVNKIRNNDAPQPNWINLKSGKLLIRVYAQKSSTDKAQNKLSILANPNAYGYQIKVDSRYKPITKPLNPGEFDYEKFLKASGLETRLRAHINRVSIIDESRGNPLTEIALIAKTRFIQTYKRSIHAPASLLVSAATLGTRRVVEHVNYKNMDISQTFRHAGVGHVLAVSGIHVSVVTILLFSLFRITGFKPKTFVPPLIGFLILFALLTGARPSSLRAVIMNSVVLITLAYFPCGLRRATAIGLAVSSFMILAVNPLVLFAPSFLLSYGAVISLILLSPPIDRWLCTFRGFALIGMVSWYILLITIASIKFYLLIDPLNILGLFGILWLIKIIGNRLNHRFPNAWHFGLERLPATIRIFLSAQIAIQIGMMIPMSAWFFGQFPIAGILVNLLAIPLVAFIVQLGMLTGLIGLIPILGPWMALPFGATVTIIANAFFWLAHAGATAFPYPATPRPTLTWLAIYYAIVTIVLIGDTHRIKILTLLYRHYPTKGTAGKLTALIWIIPLTISCLPLINLNPSLPTCRTIQCLASGRHPIISFIDSDGSATIINAGSGMTGERLLFDAIRSKGASRVKTLILCSIDPRVGLEGGASLLNKMTVQKCLLATIPAEGQTYLEAIDDPYLTSQAAAGKPWACNYQKSFSNLIQKLNSAKTVVAEIKSDTPLANWKNGCLMALPRYTAETKRFASSAHTPILTAQIGNLSWLIITDTTYDAIKNIIPTTRHFDVVITPDLSSRKSFEWWLKYILRKTTPNTLIITGEKIDNSDKIKKLVNNITNSKTTLLITSKNGAIKATISDTTTFTKQ